MTDWLFPTLHIANMKDNRIDRPNFVTFQIGNARLHIFHYGSIYAQIPMPSLVSSAQGLSIRTILSDHPP